MAIVQAENMTHVLKDLASHLGALSSASGASLVLIGDGMLSLKVSKLWFRSLLLRESVLLATNDRPSSHLGVSRYQ